MTQFHLLLELLDRCFPKQINGAVESTVNHLHRYIYLGIEEAMASSHGIPESYDHPRSLEV